MIGKAVRSFFENMESIGIKKWMIFLVIGFSVIIFFLFQQTDLIHTNVSSLAYLDGHIIDFYDYNQKVVGGNNYLPSTYILFAIWNIPIKFTGCFNSDFAQQQLLLMQNIPPNYPFTCTGLSLFWAKLLPVLVYFANAYIVFLIMSALLVTRKQPIQTAILWFTTPIAFFSQFIFGQYDSFTLFFLLLGFYFLLKNKLFKFAIFFGIACTFKYFSALLFIPLLLLAEKRLIQQIKLLILFLIPLIVVIVPYLHSPAFITGVFNFSASNYISAFKLPIGVLNVNLTIIAFFWTILCVWAFFTETTNQNDFNRVLVFASAAVFAVVFSFSFFHPQWVLIGSAFWVIQSSLSGNEEKYYFLDIILMVVFVCYLVLVWPFNVDQKLLSLGILARLFPPQDSALFFMRDLIPIKDPSLFFSIWSGLLLSSTFFKYRHSTGAKNFANLSGNFILARFLFGMGLFVIPALYCLAHIELGL